MGMQAVWRHWVNNVIVPLQGIEEYSREHNSKENAGVRAWTQKKGRIIKVSLAGSQTECEARVQMKRNRILGCKPRKISQFFFTPPFPLPFFHCQCQDLLPESNGNSLVAGVQAFEKRSRSFQLPLIVPVHEQQYPVLTMETESFVSDICDVSNLPFKNFFSFFCLSCLFTLAVDAVQSQRLDRQTDELTSFPVTVAMLLSRNDLLKFLNQNPEGGFPGGRWSGNRTSPV